MIIIFLSYSLDINFMYICLSDNDPSPCVHLPCDLLVCCSTHHGEDLPWQLLLQQVQHLLPTESPARRERGQPAAGSEGEPAHWPDLRLLEAEHQHQTCSVLLHVVLCSWDSSFCQLPPLDIITQLLRCHVICHVMAASQTLICTAREGTMSCLSMNMLWVGWFVPRSWPTCDLSTSMQ